MRLDTTGRRLVGGYRIVFAILTAVALGWQAHLAVAQGRGLVGFFSFFTIESNILATVTFAWGGAALLAGRRPPSDMIRGAVVVYLVITGVVYAVLLSSIEGTGTAPWVNTVVHQVMPVVLVLDWLIAPPARPLRLPRVWWWLVFPLLYLAYTLVRGPFANWYPYPFLDPRTQGYGHVVVGAVGVAVGFVVATLLVWWVGSAVGKRTWSSARA